MASGNIDNKLAEWSKKIQKAVHDTKIHELPEACKWYLYWRNKQLQETPTKYQATTEEANILISSAIHLMNQDNRKLIPEISKHRPGTKIRHNKIFKYIYTYEHYVHPLLIETQDFAQINETITEFTTRFEQETLESIPKLDEFQHLTLIRFVECMKQAMINSELTAQRHLIRSHDPKSNEKAGLATQLLANADYDYSHDRLLPSIIMACEALVTALYILCESYDVDVIKRLYYQPSQSFDKLEYSDWIVFLSQVGVINRQEMLDFSYLLKEWYAPKGIPGFRELSDEIVENTLELVSRFISKHQI
jgi:hypothetical protein